jgi:adenosine deaminase
MNENLIALAAAANLSRDEIVRLVKNGFAMSWLPDEDKRSYLSHVDAHATS